MVDLRRSEVLIQISLPLFPSPNESRGPAENFNKMKEGEKHTAVYILANRYRGTICIGVTRELWNRAANHKNEFALGFTSKYGLKTLVCMSIGNQWTSPSASKSKSKHGNVIGRLS
jgi:predicted GIY-YIG superfamily endonuclease